MSDIGIRSTWTVSLETPELRLVLRALGGRLTEEELPLAKALGDQLTRQRAQASKALVKQADKALDHAGREDPT